MEQQGKGLRSSLVDVAKDYDATAVAKLDLGAAGITELIGYAKGLADKTLFLRMSEVMLAMYVVLA